MTRERLGYVLSLLAVLSVTGTLLALQFLGVGRTLEVAWSAAGWLVPPFAHAANVGGSDGQISEWSGRMAAGDFVEIRAVHGDIRVLPAGGSEFSVTARARGTDLAAAGLSVERIEHDGGSTFCVVRLDDARGGCLEPGQRAGARSGKEPAVDFDVRLPAEVDFVGSTVNGSIEARDVQVDLRATAVNGDLDLHTTRSASAETVNGSIAVTLGASGLDRDVTFKTVNGSIDVDVAEDVGAVLEARWLGGGFRSEVAFTEEVRAERHVGGVLGSGGPRMRFETVNGSIVIR